MTSIQPQLWVERAGQAVDFYRQAFGASVLHLVGEDDDIVAHRAAVLVAHLGAAAGCPATAPDRCQDEGRPRWAAWA